MLEPLSDLKRRQIDQMVQLYRRHSTEHQVKLPLEKMETIDHVRLLE
jgi:hypothetical protein